MRPVRVLHALAPAPFGGLESVVAMLAAQCARQGMPVGVAMTLRHGVPLPPRLAGLGSAGVELRELRILPRGYLDEWNGYRRLFREWGPSIVHTHGYRADLVAGAAAASMGLARVTTFHGFVGGDLKNRLYERLQIAWARRCDATIAVSTPLYDRLTAAGIGPSRLHLIRNALADAPPLDRGSAREALGLPVEGRIVGWVGRLSREKGADVMLAALARLGDEDIVLSVIGDGPEREPLLRQAEASALAGRIRWHGPVPSAGRLLRAFDCVVLSSRTEGTPIVLLEAMGAGVPVVACRVGGIPDVLGEAEGLLVDPESPDQLAEAVRSTLADHAAAQIRAARSLARVRREFAPQAWGDRHAQVYEAVLKARTRRKA